MRKKIVPIDLAKHLLDQKLVMVWWFVTAVVLLILNACLQVPPVHSLSEHPLLAMQTFFSCHSAMASHFLTLPSSVAPI